MKIKKNNIIFFLLLFLFNTSAIHSAKWWDVYFTEGTPNLTANTNFEKAMGSLIAGAQHSVSIASYTWGSASSGNLVKELNNAYIRKLNVRLVGESGGPVNPNINTQIPKRLRNSDGIQHNKMIIIDAGKPTQKVVMGSANWTSGGMSTQYNNAIAISLPEVVAAYNDEFDEMFSGVFGRGTAKDNSFTAPDGSRIEIYFAPEEEWLPKFLEAIKTAKKSVFLLANNVTTFSYGGSSNAIADALITAKNNKAIVECVFDDGYYKKGVSKGVFDKIVAAGIDARLMNNPNNNSERCHNKIAIIDGELVITGSANFTKTAQEKNDENQIHIYDPVLAREYLKHFKLLMSQSQPKTIIPTYEENAPVSVKNLKATVVPDGILLTWNANNASDFDRYHIYVNRYKITTNTIINLRPEISTITDKTQKSFLLKTENTGDPLVRGQKYSIAITASDYRGNESSLTAGQSMVDEILFENINGALPSAQVEFSATGSQLVNQASTIKLTVSNDNNAIASIKQITLDCGSYGNYFRVLTVQSPENNLNWAYTVTANGRYIKLDVNDISQVIMPGSSKEFLISVKNPALTGVSQKLTLETLDTNNNLYPNVDAGELTIALNQAVNIEYATDGINNITSLNGTNRLKRENIEINFKLGSTPAAAPKIYWTLNATPDTSTANVLETSGALLNWKTVILADTSIIHNSIINFIIEIDGVIYLNTETNQPFKIKIDARAPIVTGLTTENATYNSVGLKWPVVSDIDFKEYIIFYSTTPGVSINSSRWDSSNDNKLAARSTTSTNIYGLNYGSRYYFNIAAKDDIGNISEIDTRLEVSIITTGSFPQIVYVSDGVKQITVYDGSQTLAYKSARVFIDVSNLNMNLTQGEIILSYSGGNSIPDGTKTGNPNDHNTVASGYGDKWEAIISTAYPDIQADGLVNFLLEIRGVQYYSPTGLWKFKFTTAPTDKIGGLTVGDTAATEISLSWIPTDVDNFYTYKIYYQQGDTINLGQAQTWTVNNDIRLGKLQTYNTTIKGLNPNTKYTFAIRAIDNFSNESPVSDTVSSMTSYIGGILITEIFPAYSSNRGWAELYILGGTINLNNYKLGNSAGQLTLPQITLNKNQYLVIYEGTGVSEIDEIGDVNKNGIREIYGLPTGTLSNTGGYLNLWSPVGDTINTAVWWDSESVWNSAEIDALVSTNDWQPSSARESAIRYHRGASLIRNINLYNYSGYDEKKDKTAWRNTTNFTAGKKNEMLFIQNASGVTVNNSYNNLTGSQIFKSETVTVSVFFNQIPYDTPYIYYDTILTTPNFNSPLVELKRDLLDNLKYNAVIPAQPHNSVVNFFIRIGDSFYKRNSVFTWSYLIKNLLLSAPDNLNAVSQTSNNIMLFWKPVNISDFYSYRIYQSTTGAPVVSDTYYDITRYSALGRMNSTFQLVDNLADNTNYYFSIVAVDNFGNTSPMSNTVVTATLPNVDMQKIWASDSVNSITDFAGSGKLQKKDITLFLTLGYNIPAENIELWFDTGAGIPDGPVGANINDIKSNFMIDANHPQYTYKTVISSDSLGGALNSTIKFIVRIYDKIYWNGRTDNPYIIKIDGEAPSSINVSALSYSDSSTSLIVHWAKLSALYNDDFYTYKIYYNKGAVLDKVNANVWTAAKEPKLLDKNRTYSAVHGLDTNTLYTFAITYIDDVGNESEMGDTKSAVTNLSYISEDPVYDGINVAHKLDGSEYLRHADLRVEVELGFDPADFPVSIAYSSLTIPNSQNDENAEIIQLTRQKNSGDSIIYDGWISAASIHLVHEALVRYRVFIAGIPQPQVYAFRINASIPPVISNINIGQDYGNQILLNWKSIPATPDFLTYQISITDLSSKIEQIIDKTQMPSLGKLSTSFVFLPVERDKNYILKIRAADNVFNYSEWITLLLKRNNEIDFISYSNIQQLSIDVSNFKEGISVELNPVNFEADINTNQNTHNVKMADMNVSVKLYGMDIEKTAEKIVFFIDADNNGYIKLDNNDFIHIDALQLLHETGVKIYSKYDSIKKKYFFHIDKSGNYRLQYTDFKKYYSNNPDFGAYLDGSRAAMAIGKIKEAGYYQFEIVNEQNGYVERDSVYLEKDKYYYWKYKNNAVVINGNYKWRLFNYNQNYSGGFSLCIED